VTRKATTSQHRPPQPDKTAAALKPVTPVPLLVVLILNLIIVIVLALSITNWTSIWISIPWTRCIQPEAHNWSLAIILVLLFHLIWRFLNQRLSPLAETVTIQGVNVAVKAIVQVFNALHPWQLSDRTMILFTVIPSLAIGFLGLSPQTPFYISEGTPIVKSFSVKYPDGTSVPLKQKNIIEIKGGEFVLIEAVLEQPNLLCTWSAKGTLLPTKECSVQYSAPLGELYDTLTVKVQSACGTQQTYEGLQIKVVQTNP